MARHAPFTVLTFVCLVLMALSSVAFMPVRPALSLSKMRAATLSGPSSRSPSGRSKGLTAMSGKYWEGEWVCADCGYIYNEAVRWVGGRERGRDRPTPPMAYFLSLMETFSLLLEPSPLLTLLLPHQCLRLIRPGLRRDAFRRPKDGLQMPAMLGSPSAVREKSRGQNRGHQRRRRRAHPRLLHRGRPGGDRLWHLRGPFRGRWIAKHKGGRGCLFILFCFFGWIIFFLVTGHEGMKIPPLIGVTYHRAFLSSRAGL